MMKKFATAILMAILVLGCFSCKKEDISGKLQGVWESQWEAKLNDKAGEITANEILIMQNENDAGFSGKFVQIFYGSAMLESLTGEGSVPYTAVVEGFWKVEDKNCIVMSYNIGKFEITAGKADKASDYTNVGLAMLADKFSGSLDKSLDINDDKISDKAEAAVENQLTKYFKERFHKVNKEKKGLVNVEVNGNMLTCKVVGDAFGKKLTFDRVSDDVAYKGSGKNEVKVKSLREKKGNASVDDSDLPNYDWLSNRYVTYDDIRGLSGSKLRIMRNYIFARHGYKFKSSDLQKYFAQYSWYEPRYNDVYSSLSSTEKHNVDFIKSYE